MTALARLHAVAAAMTRRYELAAPATVEYPGYIAIPEKNIADFGDVDSEAHWAVGVDINGGGLNLWTGQLSHVDGRDCGRWHIRVEVKDDASTEAIADAVYTAIGDLYDGEGARA